MTAQDIQLARQWAAFYRARGFNPLPSRTDAKRPMIKFASLWEQPLRADVFERFSTSNIQLMAGRHWRLLVIDLDGEAASDRFAKMGAVPRTWITHSGGGGWHLWFRLPASYPDRLPKAILWRGEDKHQAIERLCDQSLVMAPPSIHPATGERYRFLDKHHSPTKLPLPADCPGWVLRLRPLETHQPAARMPVEVSRAPRAATSTPSRYDRTEVLHAIPDKLALARSWGVRIAGRPNAKGWAPCHAIDRPDTHPSAALHVASGSYIDHGNGVRLSLFDLGVRMRVFRDFPDSIQRLGSMYAQH